MCVKLPCRLICPCYYRIPAIYCKQMGRRPLLLLSRKHIFNSLVTPAYRAIALWSHYLKNTTVGFHLSHLLPVSYLLPLCRQTVRIRTITKPEWFGHWNNISGVHLILHKCDITVIRSPMYVNHLILNNILTLTWYGALIRTRYGYSQTIWLNITIT